MPRVTTSAPNPVAAALTRLGLDPDDRAGRDTATATACPRCRARILVGLDDTIAARKVHVDPYPLTIRDEAAAWLSTPPRPTYRLWPRGRHLTIRARSHWQIAATPPGPDVTVVAAHACGQPLGDTTPPTASHRPPTTGVPF